MCFIGPLIRREQDTSRVQVFKLLGITEALTTSSPPQSHPEDNRGASRHRLGGRDLFTLVEAAMSLESCYAMQLHAECQARVGLERQFAVVAIWINPTSVVAKRCLDAPWLRLHDRTVIVHHRRWLYQRSSGSNSHLASSSRPS